MSNDELMKIYKTGFPWVLVNKKDKSDFRTFLCLPSAIREKEYLEEKGGKYLILPTETKGV